MSQALDQYRDQRRERMHAEVTRTIRDLDKRGLPINVSRVAAAANVSRQWLYDSPFREEIERLRDTSGSRAPRASARDTASEASLRGQNEALRQRLTELRSENADLRKELERALGLLRHQGSAPSGR